MEKAEFDVLVVILKQATRHLVAELLDRFAGASREVWCAIKRAALVAMEWVRNACRGASKHVRESLAAVKRALRELIAAAKARLAGLGAVTT